MWLTLIVVLGLSLPVYSQNRPVPPGNDQEQMKKQQEQMMEQMKKQNPKLYEQMKAAQEAQEKTTQITTDFQANKISYETAKNELRPIVEQQLKGRAENIDAEITQMEKRVEQLKNFKTNFSAMVDKAVDVRLGKAQPDQGMMF